MNDNKINLELALFSNKLLKHDATAAVAIAGVLPYFSKNKVIDILGKNDKYISKLSGRKLNSVLNFVPGHNKWDYAYSIGKLQPDAVLGLWKNMDEALPYLSKNYILISYCPVNIYIKKDSPNIFFKK